MRCAWLLLLVAGFGETAYAAEVMDGSDKEFPEPVLSATVAGLMGITNDPYSAQIARLRRAKSEPSVFCGLVNLRGKAGGYVGFQPFTIDTAQGTVFLNTDNRCEM